MFREATPLLNTASHDWHMAARGCICTGDSSGIVRTNDLARTVSYWCHPIARAVDAFRTTPTDSAWGVPLSVGRCVRDMLKHRTSIGTNILFVKLMVYLYIYIYIYAHIHTLFYLLTKLHEPPSGMPHLWLYWLTCSRLKWLTSTVLQTLFESLFPNRDDRNQVKRSPKSPTQSKIAFLLHPPYTPYT